MTNKIVFNDQQEKQIIELYRDGNFSARQVGDRFGVSHNIIRKLLAQKDLLHPNPVVKKYSINENFFSCIDTEPKAYWLGFIYADGYITRKNVFGVGLSVLDKKHLDQLVKDMDGNYPVKVYPNPGGSCERAVLSVRSHILTADLRKQGCFERKSKELVFPTSNQVPEEFISHFMRGYFDGDGSIFFSDQKYKTKKGIKISVCPHFSVISTFQFLTEFLKRLPIKTNSKVYKDYRGRQAHSIAIGGRKSVNAIGIFLYKSARTFLDRKKERFSLVENLLRKSTVRFHPQTYLEENQNFH